MKGSLVNPNRALWYRRRLHQAFTLLELLVVISVISLLAALILPALSRAREKARSLQCLNNIRQWTQVFIEYSTENFIIPREGSQTDGRVRVDNWANVYANNSRTVWYNSLPPLMDERAARDYARSEATRDEFYASRIFHCPSARFPPWVSSDANAYFSLTMNSKLIQPPVSNPEASILFTSIQRLSDTVVFLESRVSTVEWKVDPLQWDTELGQPSCFASRFAARHEEGGNLGFADGHVQWYLGTAVVETRRGRDRGFARFPDSEIIWSPDPLVNPNGPE